MSEPFLAFNRDTVDGEPERIPAADFDWEALYSSLGELEIDDEESRMRKEGARALLSRLIDMCATDIVRVRRKRSRSHVIGVRFLCVAHAMRCGALNDDSLASIGRLLGITRAAVSKTMKQIKEEATS